MESTPSIGKKFCSSVSSFNGSFSDNDTTLTPTKFRTSADSKFWRVYLQLICLLYKFFKNFFCRYA